MSLWVAVGANLTPGITALYSTTDGVSWNDGSNSFVLGSNEVTSTKNGTCFSVGQAYNGNSGLQSSPDGVNWSFDVSGFNVNGISIAEGSGTIMAVGYIVGGTAALRSTNVGQSWDTIDISTYFGDVAGIAYGNNTWLAFGTGTNTIIRSTDDGVTWSTVTGEFGGGGGYGYSAAYDGSGVWIAVGGGTNTILRSTDEGVSWNPPDTGSFGTEGRAVAYDGSGWVAVGSTPEPILRSTDGGLNWFAPTTGGFDAAGYSVAYKNGTWLAGSNGAVKMLRSTDGGDNWSPISDVNLSGVNGITFRTQPTTTTTTQAPPCFVKGTRVLTPTGYKRIETLNSGDAVLTADNRSVSIKLFTYTIDNATMDSAPYRIPANSLGGVPKNDVCVSPRHAVKDGKGRWQIPKYLGEKAQQYGIGESVTYYHIECPNYYTDNLLVEDMEVESYKNKQGPLGVVYMLDEQLGGWERLSANKLKNIPTDLKELKKYVVDKKKYIIYSN